MFASVKKRFAPIFNKQTKKVITELSKKLSPLHEQLLINRTAKKEFKYRGCLKDIREDKSWKAVGANSDILMRHVEITGPSSDPKMMINALNSDADVYMTDLEDSMSPSWENVQRGHYNIYSAIRGDLSYIKPDSKQEYRFDVSRRSPVLMTRLRGLHMFERHCNINEKPVPATIFDFATFMANNADILVKKEQSTRGGIYFYVPKIQTYEEAQFINSMFSMGEEIVGIPKGTIRATLLVETYPAIFQTEEIIYALKDYICGLNCGRWDYLFSLIKSNMETNIPNRSLLTMDQPFLASYIERIVQTCHSRGIHAMGGMSAFIPTGRDSQPIIDKILKDKMWEIKLGCDGAWVAHPGLINPVKKLFMEKLEGRNNQYEIIPQRVISDKEFLSIPQELQEPQCFTLKEFQNNLRVALKYLATWLNGNGAVAINGLMEDMATCEISLYQIKQWIKNGKALSDGDNSIIIDEAKFNQFLEEEKDVINAEGVVAEEKVQLAGKCVTDYVINENQPFLQNVAYKYL